jgi:GNAT superfamily N-acetyltransferase
MPSGGVARSCMLASVIRLAQPRDAEQVARVHVRSWQIGYRGLIDGEYLNGLRWEDRAAAYSFGATEKDSPTTIVAVDDDETIAGFATVSVTADPDCARSCELSALYVDPVRWRAGVGRALITAARGRLSGMGFESAVLWVLQGNERAARFYASDAWRPDGARRDATVWGVSVSEVRFCRTLP